MKKITLRSCLQRDQQKETNVYLKNTVVYLLSNAQMAHNLCYTTLVAKKDLGRCGEGLRALVHALFYTIFTRALALFYSIFTVALTVFYAVFTHAQVML